MNSQIKFHQIKEIGDTIMENELYNLIAVRNAFELDTRSLLPAWHYNRSFGAGWVRMCYNEIPLQSIAASR